MRISPVDLLSSLILLDAINTCAEDIFSLLRHSQDFLHSFGLKEHLRTSHKSIQPFKLFTRHLICFLLILDVNHVTLVVLVWLALGEKKIMIWVKINVVMLRMQVKMCQNIYFCVKVLLTRPPRPSFTLLKPAAGLNQKCATKSLQKLISAVCKSVINVFIIICNIL